MIAVDAATILERRQLIAREFSPRNLMRNYEGFLRQLTKQTVDEALSATEFDFVEKISADFPIQVLARLLDVPLEDTGQLIAWGNEMVGNAMVSGIRAPSSFGAMAFAFVSETRVVSIADAGPAAVGAVPAQQEMQSGRNAKSLGRQPDRRREEPRPWQPAMLPVQHLQGA